MANSRSSKKRAEVAERNRSRNSAFKSSVRTAIKKAQTLASATASDAQTVSDAVRAAQSLLDRAVCKGIMKKNKASRDKARLVAFVTKQA